MMSPEDILASVGENVRRVKPKGAKRFKPISAFVAEYEPARYVVEGIVRSGTLYTLTARTGSGKTALLASMTLAVAADRPDVINLPVEVGTVAYLAFENPDDLRTRLMVSAFQYSIDLERLDDRLLILDARKTPEEIHADLAQHSGPFALVALDTLAAGFDGRDMNDNVGTGEYLRRLRPLTALPGRPAVIVAAHPAKGAQDDALIPYGGGAILNECDGNLTLARRGDIATLHWQGKLRGLSFEPKPFRFEEASSPTALDAKGQQVRLHVLRPSAPEFIEEREQANADVGLVILRTMRDSPRATMRELAAAAGRSVSSIADRMKGLERERLVEKTLDRWNLTRKGQKAAGCTDE